MGIYLLVSILFTLLYAAGCCFNIWYGLRKAGYEGEEKTKKTNRSHFILAFLMVGVFLFFFVVNYFMQPVLSFSTIGLYIELFILLALIAVSFCTREHKDWGRDAVFVLHFKVATIVFVAGLIICGIASWDWFHVKKKREMLQVEQVSDSLLNKIVSPISVEKMAVVSPQVAQRAISIKMGDLKNTYEIKEMTKQSFSGDFEATLFDGSKVRIAYENHLVYIGVLEHKSYWTWKKTKSSPGYALVDCSDESKVYLIKEVNGQPLSIKYTNASSWDYNLERHLRNNGYASEILEDLNIELDENGRPFCPATIMKNTIILGTPKVIGVAVVDVQTGDIKRYEVDNAPAFVNMVYPEDLVYDQLYWWGDYKNGYWHWSDKAGLLNPCDGMDVVQTEDGCYYYVGMKGLSDNTTTLGYALVNTRTGEAMYFERNGISEAEAVRVLEANTDLNLEMNQGVLTLTEPVFYNIEGLKTYFATYVSTRDYTIKYYGFCSTEDKSVWGYGKTLEQAKASYLSAYYKNKAVNPNALVTSDEQKMVTIEADVLEIAQEGTAYYFRLKGYEGKTFYSYSETHPNIRWKAKKVRISYNPTDADLISMEKYDVLQYERQ